MIRVNDAQFDETAIVQEMQYQTAGSHDEAWNKACESLIISELLKQRAAQMDLAGSRSGVDDDALDALIEKEVSVPEASDSECRAYFDNNPEKFETSPLVEARHILLAAAPDDANARSEAVEQAKQLIRALESDMAQFSQLAQLHSRCPSAKTGGSLGQLSKGQTVPEFERQLFNCPEGLVPSPIETRYGVHVVDIAHHEPGRPLTYDMVKERIATYLNEKVRRKAIAQYIETLIREAEIEGFDFSVSESPLMQ